MKRIFSCLALSLLGGIHAFGHIGYTGRDFGVLDPAVSTTPVTITNQAVTGSHGWADGTDADYGDSHKTRYYRFNVATAAFVTITFSGSTNGDTKDGTIKPGFSLFRGLAHLSGGADYDSSAISASYTATRSGVPKEGCFRALDNWKVGNDAGATFADLTDFLYVGHAVDGTSALFGNAPGILGDGAADGTVTATFYLQPGDYSIFVGGADYASQTTASAETSYGLTGTVAVSSTDSVGLAFAASEFHALQGATSVNVVLTRKSGGPGSVTVALNATNGTAVAGTDFTAPAGTVNFAANETSKVVAIPLIPQAGALTTRSFTLSLGATTGGAVVGTPATTTVSIDVPPVIETQLPEIAFISPGLHASFGESATLISVTGFAQDNSGVDHVEFSLNGGAYSNLAVHAGLWSTTVTPVAGLNTLHARAVDVNGNISTTATRLFTYVKMRPLAAIVAPGDSAKGSITGLKTGNAYQIGSTYILTAVSKPGFILDYWESNQGILVGDRSPILSFTFSEGLSLVAHFRSTPFPGVKGVFNGLVTAGGSTTPGNDTEGFINITVTDKGTGSGSLLIDGLKLSLANITFASSGQALFGKELAETLVLPRKGKPSLILSLGVDMNPAVAGAHKLQGILSQQDSVKFSSVAADRAYYNGKDLKPTALLNKTTSGYYTLAFPRQAAPNNGYITAQFPQGDGVGTVTVSASGISTLTASLADGTTVTASAPLSQANVMPFFSALYSSAGSISGPLEFGTAHGDITGEDLLWFRPASAKPTPVYTAGWPNGIKVNGDGMHYNGVTTFHAALALAASGAAELSFDGGKPPVSVFKSVTISSNDKVTTLNNSYSLSIDTAKGTFKGSFTPAGQSKKSTFMGILIQAHAPEAAHTHGFFLDAGPDGGAGTAQISAP